MRKLGLLIISFVFIISCNREEIDPELIGAWEYTGVRYTFNNNGRYAINYFRAEDPTNFADSAWGTYFVDTRRDQIQFTQNGTRQIVITETDTIISLIERDLFFTTWEYEVEDGNTLRFTSNTSTGSLTRVR